MQNRQTINLCRVGKVFLVQNMVSILRNFYDVNVNVSTSIGEVFSKPCRSMRFQIQIFGILGSIPGPVKSTQCRQRLATAAMFFRSCVAHALNRGDGSPPLATRFGVLTRE